LGEEKLMMTVAELIDTLTKFPPDEAAFIRELNADDEPMFSLIETVTTSPEGVMIHAGEAVVFVADETETETETETT
jgi:hypothetical protein